MKKIIKFLIYFIVKLPIYTRREIESDFNDYIVDKYDFEIVLYLWQKILIFVLNIFTGGLGTLLLPFLNKKKKKLSIIFAALLIAILQIFYFYIFSPY